MSNIIPFSEAKNLPAHIRALGVDDDWVSGQSGGFPVLSIKSKVFHIHRGDDVEMISRQDDPDEPASAIEVVILRANKGVARVYYEKPYEEGSDDKPSCYSNDGVAPADDAEDKQSSTCATCPHSQWGSRITESGKKGKACSEVKRLAVASPALINDPMLLRVPPTSLKPWDEYVGKLVKRGLSPAQVVTKIGFDHNVSHQVLTFRPMGFVTAEMATEIGEVRQTKIVDDIVAGGQPVPAPAKPAPEPEPEPEPTPEPEDDGFGNLEGEAPAEKPKAAEKPAKTATKATKTKKAVAPEPAPEPDKGDEGGAEALASELDDMLSDLDFDD